MGTIKIITSIVMICFVVETAEAHSHKRYSRNYSHRGSVRGYLRNNGTYVMPYHRTAPNHTKQDNYSTKGNTNPYTGKKGTVNINNNYGSRLYASTYQLYDKRILDNKVCIERVNVKEIKPKIEGVNVKEIKPKFKLVRIITIKIQKPIPPTPKESLIERLEKSGLLKNCIVTGEGKDICVTYYPYPQN